MNFHFALLIPIFAIVFGLSIPIIYVITEYRKRRRLIELHHAERMAAIERGIELPPLPAELIGASAAQKDAEGPRSTLLPGLMWLFVGIALLFFLRRMNDDIALAGLIPAAAGLAYLVYYFVAGRKERDARKPGESTRIGS